MTVCRWAAFGLFMVPLLEAEIVRYEMEGRFSYSTVAPEIAVGDAFSLRLELDYGRPRRVTSPYSVSLAEGVRFFDLRVQPAAVGGFAGGRFEGGPWSVVEDVPVPGFPAAYIGFSALARDRSSRDFPALAAGPLVMIEWALAVSDPALIDRHAERLTVVDAGMVDFASFVTGVRLYFGELNQPLSAQAQITDLRVTVVPEPAAAGLIAGGLAAGLALVAARRRTRIRG